MKTEIRHLSNYLISVEPDLLLAQPNPSQIYECPSIDECLRIVPNGKLFMALTLDLYLYISTFDIFFVFKSEINYNAQILAIIWHKLWS